MFIFKQLLTFFKAQGSIGQSDFLKSLISLIMGDILGYFLLYEIITLKGSFETCFAIHIFRFQKGSDVDVWDFKIEHDGRYFDIFGLCNSLGNYFQKFGNFFQKLGDFFLSPEACIIKQTTAIINSVA